MKLLGELPVTFEYLTKDVSAVIKRWVAKRGPAEDLWLLEGVPVVQQDIEYQVFVSITEVDLGHVLLVTHLLVSLV
jgi:hypothetical protein